MKHSNFDEKLYEIKERMISELKAALRAHGGSYDFEVDDYCPSITAYPYKAAVNKEEVRVKKAYIGEGDVLSFVIISEYGVTENVIHSSDILDGEMDWIIDCIPETPEVSDVTGK